MVGTCPLLDVGPEPATARLLLPPVDRPTPIASGIDPSRLSQSRLLPGFNDAHLHLLVGREALMVAQVRYAIDQH